MKTGKSGGKSGRKITVFSKRLNRPHKKTNTSEGVKKPKTIGCLTYWLGFRLNVKITKNLQPHHFVYGVSAHSGRFIIACMFYLLVCILFLVCVKFLSFLVSCCRLLLSLSREKL